MFQLNLNLNRMRNINCKKQIKLTIFLILKIARNTNSFYLNWNRRLVMWFSTFGLSFKISIQTHMCNKSHKTTIQTITNNTHFDILSMKQFNDEFIKT